jgi:hypothetical protein
MIPLATAPAEKRPLSTASATPVSFIKWGRDSVVHTAELQIGAVHIEKLPAVTLTR